MDRVYTTVSIAIVVLTVFLGVALCHKIYTDAQKHICEDKTHVTCDGECECDGFGCPR
jgi:hypothetical protein